MIVQFNGIAHATKRLASRCSPWERLVDGGLTGFRLARDEAWRRNDRDGDDAFPVARDMAQQTRRRAQGQVRPRQSRTGLDTHRGGARNERSRLCFRRYTEKLGKTPLL